MNIVFKKIAAKILLIPRVKRLLERIWQFYERARVQNIQRLDIKRGLESYEMLRAVDIRDLEQLDIKENFREGDAKALEQLVGMVLKDNIMIAEVGSWKGFSTSVLAKAVVNHNGKVFAVDHWMGSEEVKHHERLKAVDIYSIFKRNMIALGVWDIVHPMVMDSQTASQIFADGILDLVFIDADHRYESFKKDIWSWLPKLRDGGILCGHDCEGYYSKYPEEVKKMIEEHLGDDYIREIICHPGVAKALHECFQDRYQIMPNSIVWYHIKKEPASTC